MDELHSLLKRFFGYSTFRPLQLDIIQHLLQREDALVLMPTGGGKSVCYQLPAIYFEGVTLVISPLISLMKDQVEGLRASGIPAAALNSLMPEAEQQQIKQLAREDKLKLLYISPERVKAEMRWFLPHLNISLIAIDEAHCISHWGHDFRPEYTQLAILKERFPQVPIIALTATADKVTRTDIINQLQLRNPRTFIASFDRPNLSLSVEKGLDKKEKIRAIVRFIQKRRGKSGIIYCQRRADTEMLAAELQRFGFAAAFYHAGMEPQDRDAVQTDFINDRIPIICATVAFGMGIDKSNVRWVIHYSMPGSIENYYQEIGRAGRDGAPADTLLFFSIGDMILLRRFVEESGQQEINAEKLEWMRRYCESSVCRRRVLLSYFGESTTEDCHNCDICSNPPARFDGSILVQKALSALARANESIGMTMLIDILRGSEQAALRERGFHLLKTYGAGRDLSFSEWRGYLYQMIQLGFLEVDALKGHVLRITPTGRDVLFGKQKAYLSRFREEAATDPYTPQPIRRLCSSSVESSLLDALTQLRKQLAAREKVPVYRIFTDDTLNDIVEQQPITLEDFAEIRGVSDMKLRRYGRVFVSLIRFVLRLPKLPPASSGEGEK